MKKIVSLVLSVFLMIMLVACGSGKSADTAIAQGGNIEEKLSETPALTTIPTQTQNASSSTNQPTSTGQLKVHFIDVGQADSILVQDGSSTMLIDAGNNADSDLIVNYLKQQGVNKIDYLIGTHPHEDHIGGMDVVINTFDIGTVYMPKVTSNTETFEDVVTAIKNKDMTITSPVPGSSFNLTDSTCTILAPNNNSYEDLNDYSIVIKLVHGGVSFLLTGDAETVSENEMLAKGYDVAATVLKIGHHGSNSSTSDTFLKKVNPKYAVISVGKGNDYGHPEAVTLNKLSNAGIKVYRTDESGTIVATSDKTNVTFDKGPSAVAPNKQEPTPVIKPTATPKPTVVPTQAPPANNDRTVYWTPSGKSYHYSKDCSTLSRSKTILSGPLSECPKSDPCDKCVK